MAKLEDDAPAGTQLANAHGRVARAVLHRAAWETATRPNAPTAVYVRYVIVEVAPPADGRWRFLEVRSVVKNEETGKRGKVTTYETTDMLAQPRRELSTDAAAEPLVAFGIEYATYVAPDGTNDINFNWTHGSPQVYARATLEAWFLAGAAHSAYATVPKMTGGLWCFLVNMPSPPAQRPPLTVTALRMAVDAAFQHLIGGAARAALLQYLDAAAEGTIVMSTVGNDGGGAAAVDHVGVERALHWFADTFLYPLHGSKPFLRAPPRVINNLRYYDWPHGARQAGSYNFDVAPTPARLRESKPRTYEALDALRKAALKTPPHYDFFDLYRYVVGYAFYIGVTPEYAHGRRFPLFVAANNWEARFYNGAELKDLLKDEYALTKQGLDAALAMERSSALENAPTPPNSPGRQSTRCGACALAARLDG